jgi:hypothetical protein
LDTRRPEDFQARVGTSETYGFLHDRMQNLPLANAFILIDAARQILPINRRSASRH